MAVSAVSNSGIYGQKGKALQGMFGGVQNTKVSATTGSPTITSFTGNGTIGTNGVVYDVYKFTQSGSITLSEGLIDMLLVVGGGGGSGGYAATWGAGGGAGAMLELSRIYVVSGLYTVTVGSAGNWNTSGGKSSFETWGAEGGSAGNLYSNGPHRGGGSGGGGGGDGAPSPPSGAYSDLPYTRIGGYGNNSSGGGGGGAGGNGTNSPGSNSGGGAGRASTITGSSVTYARGGSAGQNGSPSNNVANSGNGGVGRNGDGGDFSASTGVVIVRMAR